MSKNKPYLRERPGRTGSAAKFLRRYRNRRKPLGLRLLHRYVSNHHPGK